MTGESATTWSLFEEPYWLDCVAPGDWDAVELKRDNEIIGRLPYVIKRRYGVTAISTPWLTPWLGPWIRPSGGKLANELGYQHQVLTTLIEGLPKVQKTFIACAPEFQNLMALHWAGYHLKVTYTHRLTSLDDEQALWSRMRNTTRAKCRKAEKATAINMGRSIGDLISILLKTYQRQGKDFSASFPVLERIDDAMRARNQCRLYCAEDAKGQIHAALYVVFDRRHCFAIASGGDPVLRESGAQALVEWHAIKDAGKHSLVFDFTGSMIQPIENFMRGFGPQQVLRLSAFRSSRAIRLFEVLAGLPKSS
jgi:Acetyltransferase (GNAT) domain